MITIKQATYLLNTYKNFFDNIDDNHPVAKNIYNALCAIKDNSNSNLTLNTFNYNPQLTLQNITTNNLTIKQGFHELPENLKDDFGDLIGDINDPLLKTKTSEESNLVTVMNDQQCIDLNCFIETYIKNLNQFLYNKKDPKNLINASQNLFQAIIKKVGIEPEKYTDKIQTLLEYPLKKIKVDSTQIRILDQLVNQLGKSNNDNHAQAFHSIHFTCHYFSEKNKVLNLKKFCADYKQHLIKNINNKFKKLPAEVFQQYSVKNSKIDIDGIVTKNGSEINQDTFKKPDFPPSLCRLIKKYMIVNQLHSAFSENNATDEQKIKKFQKTLTENINTLKKHRTRKGILFLHNVLHVLSVGIYSKLTKGTFQFWKSHGEVFSEKSLSTLKTQY